MSDGEEIYVGLHDVMDLRKEALTSSKAALSVLKKYEYYKRLRAEKLQHVVKWYRLLAEISSLNRKIRAGLPKIVLPEQPEPTPLIKEDKVRAIGRSAKSKLDVLEEELAAIESRLSALG